MTTIEWTRNADGTQGKSWNPVVGCTILSPGCTNCYAMRMAARLEAMAGDGLDDNGYAVRGTSPLDRYRGLTKPSKAGPVWTGKVALAPEHTLTEPLRRRKPTTWFVNSMSDLFHEAIPDEWIDRVFAVMALCPQHTFIVLTKRSARMRAYLSHDADTIMHRWCNTDAWMEAENRVLHDDMPNESSASVRETARLEAAIAAANHPLPNVWLGVTAERQQEADERIPDLLATPAAVRLVSAEPLLGPVDFTRIDVPEYGNLNALDDGYFTDGRPPRRRLDWIIVGGESGPGARPMHPAWARSVRDQCKAAGVPFFFKQWGEWAPCPGASDWPYDPDYDRTTWFNEPTCVRPAETGWADKYHIGKCRAQDPFLLAPYGGSLFGTPEYLEQVSRCPQADCRAAGKCVGNKARRPARRVGKSRAGRLLDGIEHSEMPSARTTEAA